MLLVNIDGASRGNPGRAASAAIFQRDGTTIKQSARVISEMETNNVAEYRALLGALRYLPTIRQPGEPVEIRSDSKLVVEQANGRWQCKEFRLQALHREARELLAVLGAGVTLRYVPREQNREADALCNRALDRQGARSA